MAGIPRRLNGAGLNTAKLNGVPGLFVRMKLRLLRNSLSQSDSRTVGFILGSLFALFAAVTAAASLLALRGGEHAADAAVTVFAAAALGWLVLPLFFGGGDETADPVRLAMLPLRPGQLLAGSLAAALTGPGPLVTAVLLAGAAFTAGHGAVGTLTALPATVLGLLFTVVLSRAVLTALSRLLTSRRGREAATAVGLLLAFGAYGVNFLLMSHNAAGAVRPVARVLRHTPPGWAADAPRAAGHGAYGTALLELLGTALATALLAWWWHAALSRLLVSGDASTGRPGAVHSHHGGLPARLLPGGRTGAVARHQLRYSWRSPRHRMTWVAALATSALFPLFLARGAGTAAVLFAPVMLGAQTTVVNQFGMDGSAVWSNAVTALTVKDARAELRGRLLAVAVLTVPWTALVAVAAAVVHGGFGRLPAVLGLTYALLGALLAVGLYVSVRWPYSVKDTRMGAQPAPGQQGAAWLSSFAGLLVCTALIMPVVLVHGLAGNVATAVVGPLYGLALAAGLVHYGGRLLYDRFPELLLDVAKS